MDWALLGTLVTLAGFVAIPYGFIITRIHQRLADIQKRMDDTYSKKEIKHLVGLSTAPIKETTDRLISSHEKLIDAIHKLELTLASNDK